MAGAARPRVETASATLAAELFGTWVWPFEVLSLLLLVATATRAEPPPVEVAPLCLSRVTGKRRACERSPDPPIGVGLGARIWARTGRNLNAFRARV